MGGKLSGLQELYKRDLLFLLAPTGHNERMAPLIHELLLEIARVSPSFFEGNSLDLKKWDEVGLALRNSNVPSALVLHTWKLCRDGVAKISNPLLQLQDIPSGTPRLSPPLAVVIPLAASLPVDSYVSRSVSDEMPVSYSVGSCPEAVSQTSIQKLAREIIKEDNSAGSKEALALMANFPNEQIVMEKLQEVSVFPSISTAREQQVAADVSFLNVNESRPPLRKLSSPVFTELPISVNVSKAKDFFPILNEQTCIVKDAWQEDARVFLSVSNELICTAEKFMQEVFEFSTFQSGLGKIFFPEQLCLGSVSRRSFEIAAYEPD